MAERVLEPLLTCPFKDVPVSIQELPIGVCETPMYRARGPFWVTEWYSDKQALLHDISHRGGVPPGFPRVLRAVQEAKECDPPRGDPRDGIYTKTNREVDTDKIVGILKGGAK